MGANTIEEAVERGEQVAKELNKLYPELAKSWNGEKECQMTVKLEKVYDSWFQMGAKKRYVGLVGWDGDTDEKFIGHLPVKDRMDIKGLEIIRSNAAELTKEVQEKVVIEPIVAAFVDRDACRGCGLCVALCPYGALEIEKTTEGRKVKLISASCKGCGICANECPQEAIKLVKEE